MQAKKWLIAVFVIGGLAVLCSYCGACWPSRMPVNSCGAVCRRDMRPYYTVNMLLAAAGYFPFTFFILFRLDPRRTKVPGKYGYGLFAWLYAAILIPSALWLPLTYLAVGQSSQAWLWVARAALALVGAASLGILIALLKVRPSRAGVAYWLAVVGSIFFCIQTVILDAIIWGATIRL